MGQPTVNWQRIEGFRDFLINNYDKIDLKALLWGVVEDIPTLKAAVQALLDTLDRDSNTAEGG